MLSRPCFKPCYRVEAIGDTVFVIGERTNVALIGRAYVTVAPLLDGEHSLEDIVVHLRGTLSALEVHAILDRLTRRDLLTEPATGLSGAEAAFWSEDEASLAAVGERLRDGCVEVRSFGSASGEQLGQALASVGVRVCEDGPESGFTAIVTDDYLHPDLATWNQEAQSTGRAWMLIKPNGREAWLGPTFVPGSTGCWRCLADRLEANRPLSGLLRHHVGSAAPPASSLPSTEAAVMNLAATYICRRLVSSTTELDGEMRSLDLSTLSTQAHFLFKRPQCPICGDNTPATAKAVTLESRPKVTTRDGGHRGASAAATLRRLEKHVSPITGVVRGLRRLDAPSELMNVYQAEYPSAEYGDPALHRGGADSSFGKGETDAQARASALGEAIERYCGAFTGSEPRRRATLAELKEDAVHPRDILHFSERQIAGRDEWNRAHSGYAWVGQSFQEERELDWTPLWSLTNHRSCYVPTAHCYYGFPLPADHQFCRADSNGNASGSTLEDAILQGFLEVVERDSIALWWYSRAPRPAVDLDAVDDPYLARLREAYSVMGRELWVLDVTSDLGIPTMAAISRDVRGAKEHLLQGYGCHLDPRIALGRALTELNQMLMLISRPAPTEQPKSPSRDPDNERWFTEATLATQPYLVPDSAAKEVALLSGAQLHSDDLREDLQRCVALIAEHGMEILLLDQTRPDIGIPVVKVVVPGMRHFWPRFAQGRLYDIPLQLGWVDHRLTEDELNPIPISS